MERLMSDHRWPIVYPVFPRCPPTSASWAACVRKDRLFIGASSAASKVFGSHGSADMERAVIVVFPPVHDNRLYKVYSFPEVVVTNLAARKPAISVAGGMAALQGCKLSMRCLCDRIL